MGRKGPAQAKGSGCSHSPGSREMQRKVLDQISHFLGRCWVFVWNMGSSATVTSCANERTSLPAASEEDHIPAATNQLVQAPREPSTCPMAVPTQAMWGTSINKHFGQVELYTRCTESNWSWKQKDTRSSTGFTHHPPLPSCCWRSTVHCPNLRLWLGCVNNPVVTVHGLPVHGLTLPWKRFTWILYICYRWRD